VALVDYLMPGLSGTELARQLRRRIGGKTPADGAVQLRAFEGGPEARREGFAALSAQAIKPSSLFNILIRTLDLSPTLPERAASKKAGPRNGEALSAAHPARGRQCGQPEDRGADLERLGYRPDVAGNGIEAVQACSHALRVVLMDVQMPELDGLDATRQILHAMKRKRRPRIVAMTANARRGPAACCRPAWTTTCRSRSRSRADPGAPALCARAEAEAAHDALTPGVSAERAGPEAMRMPSGPEVKMRSCDGSPR